ncbi:CLUMA_CG015932, isoform A [Clunio marinus]|uniref:CLUMA_CG015932, isoform A n=1 Tax=Clunio marinus TaxID=568069 RepID=A0A1J1IRL3_9DIPT|nr:CLUMA_CG015932, isoform A [Clunio marinus]
MFVPLFRLHETLFRSGQIVFFIVTIAPLVVRFASYLLQDERNRKRALSCSMKSSRKFRICVGLRKFNQCILVITDSSSRRVVSFWQQKFLTLYACD